MPSVAKLINPINLLQAAQSLSVPSASHAVETISFSKELTDTLSKGLPQNGQIDLSTDKPIMEHSEGVVANTPQGRSIGPGSSKQVNAVQDDKDFNSEMQRRNPLPSDPKAVTADAIGKPQKVSERVKASTASKQGTSPHLCKKTLYAESQQGADAVSGLHPSVETSSLAAILLAPTIPVPMQDIQQPAAAPKSEASVPGASQLKSQKATGKQIPVSLQTETREVVEVEQPEPKSPSGAVVQAAKPKGLQSEIKNSPAVHGASHTSQDVESLHQEQQVMQIHPAIAQGKVSDLTPTMTQPQSHLSAREVLNSVPLQPAAAQSSRGAVQEIAIAVNDTAHGPVNIRAELGRSGEVHVTATAASEHIQSALAAEVPRIREYLATEQVRVDSLHVESPTAVREVSSIEGSHTTFSSDTRGQQEMSGQGNSSEQQQHPSRQDQLPQLQRSTHAILTGDGSVPVLHSGWVNLHA